MALCSLLVSVIASQQASAQPPTIEHKPPHARLHEPVRLRAVIRAAEGVAEADVNWRHVGEPKFKPLAMQASADAFEAEIRADEVTGDLEYFIVAVSNGSYEKALWSSELQPTLLRVAPSAPAKPVPPRPAAVAESPRPHSPAANPGDTLPTSLAAGDLIPIPPPTSPTIEDATPAVVSLTSEPSGLVVTLSGKSLGKTPVPDLSLAPGTYDLAVVDACWSGETTKLSVASGEVRAVRLAPQPRRAHVTVSVLGVDGASSSGSLSVDGQLLGAVPGSYDISVCSKELDVAGPHGEVWRTELALREGAQQVQGQFPAAPPRAQPPAAVAPPAAEVPRHRYFAVRAGFGAETGVLGLGLEFRPWDLVGIALGTGTTALAGGVSFALWRTPYGPLYLDVDVVWVHTGIVGEQPGPGVGLSGTVGYDWRPAPWWSIKGGVGAGWNSTASNHANAFTFDLCTGPVF